MKDLKTRIILALVLIIVVLIAFIGAQAIRARVLAAQQQTYLKGMQDGRLVEQRNIIQGIITYGKYVIPVIDENNQTQNIVLAMLPQQQLLSTSGDEGDK